MNLDSKLKKIISWLFSSLFFLVPLFFTSVNSELFEFNKIILTYGLTVLIVGVWVARMIIQKKLLFKKTPLDIPLIVFLASQLLSLIFSIDPHTSFWGYYSRFNGGLLSLIAYSLLYWAFVSNCEAKDVQKVLKSSLASALIVSIYGILEHLGHSFSCLMFTGSFDVSCWVQDVKNRVFASLGQPNWLATYLTTLIPVTLAFVLCNNPETRNQEQRTKRAKNNESWWKRIVHASLFIILFMCLIFTGSRSGFLAFVVSLAVFGATILLTNRHNLKPILRPLIHSCLSIVLVLIVFGSPFDQLNRALHYKSWLEKITPFTTQETPLATSEPAPFISESGDIRKIVWKGAIDIFKHYPLFGSGVETFAYSYYNFRPLEHNLVSEWDFLYNKAHNEYLNYLSTTGAVGLGAYLFFIGAFVVWSIIQFKIQNAKCKIVNQNSKSESGNFEFLTLHFALFSGWLSILISNFFGFSVVVVSLYFYLIPAFVFVLNKQDSPEIKNSKYKIQKIPFAILLFTIFYLLLTVVNLWRADYFYAQALKLNKQGNYDLAYQKITKALELSPDEPVFLNDLSAIAASRILVAATKSNITLAQEMFVVAINSSDKALEASPYNLNIHKNRIKVFYTLGNIDPEYLEKAIEATKAAIKLAPTDPKLVYNLGLLYSRAEKTEEALSAVHKAIEMKPNYEEARNVLAAFYEDLGRKEEAIKQLQYILETKKNDPSILERIELLKKK